MSYADSRKTLLFLGKSEITEPQALVLPLKAVGLMQEARTGRFSHLQIGRALLTTVMNNDVGNIWKKSMNMFSSFLIYFLLHRQHP